MALVLQEKPSRSRIKTMTGRMPYQKKMDSIMEYAKIMEDYAKNQNPISLSTRLRFWSQKNNRDPSLIYRYQMRILKWR